MNTLPGSWWLDLKLGLRMLIKYPGLALAGGFGIAVAVAIGTGGFSVIYSNYFSSALPLDEGDRIVALEYWDAAANKPERRTLRDFPIWREQMRSVQEVSTFRNLTPNLTLSPGQSESVRVAAMTASGFRLARVRPLLGRYLEDADEREGSPAVVVIGENIWRNRFAADPQILNRTLQLGSTHYAIAGVMPESFAFPFNHRFWIPLRASTDQPLSGPDLTTFARLAPSSTIEAARAEFATVWQRTAATAFPQAYAQLQPQVLPYPHPFLGLHTPQEVSGLHAMQGITTMLLILVCLNVAILVYTRTAMRQSEISVRTALGASRGRIVTQLFMEALALSGVAALVGIGIAAAGLQLLTTATRHIAQDLPFWLSFQLAPQAVLYAGVLSVLAAAIVGVVPALQATRRELQNGLRSISGGGGSGMRLGKVWTVLIVAQVGFAVAILPPAISGAWQDARDGLAGPGFAAETYLSAQLGMDAPGPLRLDELHRRLEADPRVSAVAFSAFQPGDEAGARVEVQSSTESQAVRYNRVDINFLRTFEVTVLAGRGFTASDATSSTILVNQSFAKQVFAGGDPLGRRIRYAQQSRRSASGQTTDIANTAGGWYEIVGIVADFPPGVSQGMRDSPRRIYHAAPREHLQSAAIAIRMRGGVTPASAQFAEHLRDIALSVDPDLYVRNVRGLDEALRSEQWISRAQAAVIAAVAASVLLLSAAGIYALMSFTVSQRRKEIGIRIALGASRNRIITSIFSRAFRQLGIGAALGLAIGISLELLSTSSGAGDSANRGYAAIVLPGVAMAMIAVGIAAAWGPARRCLDIAPTDALREQ